MNVSIGRFQLVNAQRATDWHGSIESWSGLEWAGAMCGEAGEAANVAKKLRRLEQGLLGNPDGTTYAGLVAALGDELADTVAYACLLASRYHIDLERVTVEKFNAISGKHGFPHRL